MTTRNDTSGNDTGPWRRLLPRLRTARRRVRRVVLGHRRALAALLTAVAVAATLRTVAPPPPPTQEVMVAGRDLPTGTVLARGDLVQVDFAPASVPGGLATDYLGRTLAAPLRRGEPVTDVRLVAPALTEGYPGLVAVPVRLPDPAAVGLLATGDRIDVYAAPPRGGGARMVVPAATVLAVPAPSASAESGAVTGRLVVLGVPAASVTGLADAAVQDFLSFAFTR